jgi:hypothetical protein
MRLYIQLKNTWIDLLNVLLSHVGIMGYFI